MRALSIVLAFAYGALAGVAAIYAFFDGAFGCWDDCVEAPHKWRLDAEAWQWDAILWLGVAGAVAALLVVVLAFAGRWWAVPALAVHASLLTAAAVLMVGGGTVSYQFTATWLVLTCAAALALIRVRRRSRRLAPLRVE